MILSSHLKIYTHTHRIADFNDNKGGRKGGKEGGGGGERVEGRRGREEGRDEGIFVVVADFHGKRNFFPLLSPPPFLCVHVCVCVCETEDVGE